VRTLVKNGVIIVDGVRRIDHGAVLIDDGFIVGVFNDYDDIVYDVCVDAKGNFIIPGLIETHTHGIMGYDFNTCCCDDIQKISDALLDEGVTSFMASLVAEKHDDLIRLLDMYEHCDVHNLIGVHIEGPFLSKKFTGVIPVECFQEPNLDHFYEYIDYDKVKSMTIAPEINGALEIINVGSNHGIVMNVGHSNANASDVLLAEQYGAKGITHLYNAMSQFLHRDPGVVTGAVLSSLFCELICDGFHIHEDIIKASYKMIGKDRLVLICDANPCKGLADGDYSFSGKNVEIIDGKARVKETGRIAGSTLCLNEACRNMMEWCDCSIDDVVRMACFNPARMYNLNAGQISIGYIGNIVVVNDCFDVLAVINEGEVKRNML